MMNRVACHRGKSRSSARRSQPVPTAALESRTHARNRWLIIVDSIVHQDRWFPSLYEMQMQRRIERSREENAARGRGTRSCSSRRHFSVTLAAATRNLSSWLGVGCCLSYSLPRPSRHELNLGCAAALQLGSLGKGLTENDPKATVTVRSESSFPIHPAHSACQPPLRFWSFLRDGSSPLDTSIIRTQDALRTILQDQTAPACATSSHRGWRTETRLLYLAEFRFDIFGFAPPRNRLAVRKARCHCHLVSHHLSLFGIIGLAVYACLCHLG